MLAAEIIERKRDGEELGPGDLRAFLDGYLDGAVETYQMAAFLMAVYFQGLSREELGVLTRAIVASGRTLDFGGGERPAVDKHSTGGVGDKVSLVLSPLLAAAGLRVPMMSGRGLGHTGGTLDKLEAIPGFRTDLALAEFERAVEEIGCAMIGQTEDIAPLDGRLYALRDVTGTVQSIPLIASSIVSKKAAEGVEALVLDVKCGAGAFMREEPRALELADALVELAEAEGLRARALVTGMEAPLGRAVGNAVEVAESVACLQGGGPADLREVTLALSAELAHAATGEAIPDARERLASLLDGGEAAERFGRMVERQGGDPRVLDDPGRLPSAPVEARVSSPADGWLASLDAREVGRAAVELGAGRRKMGEPVDPSVGVLVDARPGDRVEAGEPLMTVLARTEDDARRAGRRLEAAVELTSGEPETEAVAWEGRRVRWRVTPGGRERLG